MQLNQVNANNSGAKDVSHRKDQLDDSNHNQVNMVFNTVRQSVVKSPSDTTLYVPALAKNMHDKIHQDIGPPLNRGGDMANNQNNYAQLITDFIEGVRMNSRMKTPQDQDTRNVHRRLSREFNKNDESAGDGKVVEQQDNLEDHRVRDRLLREAKERANKIVLEAEQYKAQLEQLKGMLSSNCMDTDDEFFHITCHLDPAIRSKIEKGEFVDLDKLLPKERYDSRQEGRVDLVHKDGQTYFRAHEKDNKITGIRKWEQAFRVYAAVYSMANPQRAGEIWQYVYIINTAAASYIWDDVAHYDYIFRQLMSANPQHSWAKIYNQMWNLAMRNPINHRKKSRKLLPATFR